MVLRDKHRAAEPDTMASDQPLKKKQRTHPPDGEDAVDRAAPSTSETALNGVRDRRRRLGFPDPAKPERPTTAPDLDAIGERLAGQCLCGASDDRLGAPFATRLDIAEWPPDDALAFLSRLQLLFDVYLKQNYKGHVCPKIMDACNALIGNEHDWLGEVVRLADHRDKYVNFAACKAISGFLIVAKNGIDHEWLRAIMDAIARPPDAFDATDINKLNFSLDIIKRVLEWKDQEQHPLEDSAYINTSNPVRSADEPGSSRSNPRASHSTESFASDVDIAEPSISEATRSDDENVGCEPIALTDSESLDTSHVKCLTIRCLERYWPTLIDSVKRLLTAYLNVDNSENCILTFLALWENIISVKANLSVVDTKPFYMDFQSFVELLRYTNLPSLIYTRLLSLFNEVLCYGSTLALQDVLPEETCTLAHSIVRFVKDFRLLDGIRLRHDRTGFNFIGFDSPAIASYALEDSSSSANESRSASATVRDARTTSACETDKTMLQKMVLLVLKSVAVTVKEMRCDSSDSSIDSTDYNAIQDMQMVERSIRDVLIKLDVFLKRTLNFLPDSPFTKILIHLFSDQDDYLIESMVCTLDITVGIVYRNSVFPDLIPMLNPVASFVEFLQVVSYHSDILLDYLVSNETCFLLYLLRFLKYVRKNWSKFVASCRNSNSGTDGLDNTMAVLTRLRLQINRLVSLSLFPYNIGPVLKLLEKCEDLYEGNELS